MTLSIIVPVYKVEEWVKECLGSIACQDMRGWEIVEVIIVDDASPDGSMDMVRSFIEAYRGPLSIKILRHATNKGLSEARNTAIREATGDYLLFLDSDDMLAPGSLRRFAEAASRYPRAEVIFGYTRCIPEETAEQEQYYRYDRRLAPRYTRLGWSTRHWWLRLPETAHNKLVRRDWLLRNKLFFEPGVVHEDTLWHLEAREHLSHIATIPCTEPTLLYRQRASSITSEEDERTRLENTVRVYALAAGRIKHWDLQMAQAFRRILQSARRAAPPSLQTHLTTPLRNNPYIPRLINSFIQLF